MTAARTYIGAGDLEVGSSTGHVNDLEIITSPSNAEVRRNIEGQFMDMDEWAGSLARILDDVPQYMCRPGHPGRISKIPENLREVDVKAYEPYFISFGPYHHENPRVRPMEKSKCLALKAFLEYKADLSLKDYLKVMKSIEPAARNFYSEVEMDSEKFLQMLLLDSLYILATFCGIPNREDSIDKRNTRTMSLAENEIMNETGQEFSNSVINWVATDNTQLTSVEDEQNDEANGVENDATRLFSAIFEHDLFLLENQIPFFVLTKVFALAYDGSETQLLGIMKDRFNILLPGYTKLDSEMLMIPTEDVHHLLHLCHLFFRPTLQHKNTPCQLSESGQMFRLGSAVQLYEAGVRFEARSPSTQHSLLDITFCSSGKMIMPCLRVDDNTNSLLRNLIALEQMKYPSIGLDVSAYAVLLLHLVTTPEDARLLRRNGIIQHHLASDKEMMYLVNKLSVGLSFDYAEDRYSLKPVFKELKKYTDRRGPRWRAWLTHRYFNNPWTAISLAAATTLLILTVVQTFYSVYSYYHPYFGGQL